MSIESVTASAPSQVQPIAALAAVAPKSGGGAATTPATGADQVAMYPNPASHLDPELHIVILEFRNAAGEITESLPTTQQLDQYRLKLTEGPAASMPKSSAATSIQGWG
jgi:hypothetical protein